MHRLMTATVLVASLTYTHVGSTQAPGDSARRQQTFESLRDSQMIRVAGPGLGRREGRLLGLPAGEIVLGGDQPLRIPATQIDTVWTKGGSALAGGLIGGLLGAGLGFLAATQFGEDDTEDPGVTFIAGGLVGGGLLGALIGNRSPRWHRRYP